MTQTGLFESFALLHEPGLLRDRYTFTGRLRPLAYEQLWQEVGIGRQEPAEVEFVVHMPGHHIMTNGLPISNENNAFLWRIHLEDPPWIQATSQIWNGWNMLLLGLGVLLLIFVGLLISTLISARGGSQAPRRSAAAQSSTRARPGQSFAEATLRENRAVSFDRPATTAQAPHLEDPGPARKKEDRKDLLTSLNVHGILSEFNQHVLNGQGSIEYAPGELSLTWQPPSKELATPVIQVHCLGDWLVTINGQSVPTTQQGIKQGIATIYRQLRDGGRA